MNAASQAGRQTNREHRRQCLPFAGLHFHQIAVMQSQSREQLNIERLHSDCPRGDFADGRERFDPQRLNRDALLNTVTDRGSSLPQLLIRERRQLRSQFPDLLDLFLVAGITEPDPTAAKSRQSGEELTK